MLKPSSEVYFGMVVEWKNGRWPPIFI